MTLRRGGRERRDVVLSVTAAGLAAKRAIFLERLQNRLFETNREIVALVDPANARWPVAIS